MKGGGGEEEMDEGQSYIGMANQWKRGGGGMMRKEGRMKEMVETEVRDYAETPNEVVC